MTPLEIALLIGGALIFVISFIIPSGKTQADGDLRKIVEDEVKTKVASEMDSVKSHLDDVVDEAVDYAQEKTERSLERISNEKIMAVNEYSDTVLEEINKNHKEVMFLYDMLNDKHDTLVKTVGEAEKVESDISGQTAEAKKVLDDSLKILEESKKNCDEAKVSYDRAQEALDNARESVANAEAVFSNVQENVIKAEPENTAEQEQLFYSENPVWSEKIPDSERLADSEELTGTEVTGDSKENNDSDDISASEEVNASESAADSDNIPTPALKEEKKESEVKVRTLKWAAFAQQQADEALNGNDISSGAVNIDYPVLPKPSRNIVSNSIRENEVNPQAQLHNEVLALHRLGQSDVEIARSLNMGVGEVSLIIGLHGNDK